MYYETKNFTELVQKMASCYELGLFYAVQKDFKEETKWFSNEKKRVPFYKLQIIEYEEESHETGRPSESESETNE